MRPLLKQTTKMLQENPYPERVKAAVEVFMNEDDSYPSDDEIEEMEIQRQIDWMEDPERLAEEWIVEN